MKRAHLGSAVATGLVAVAAWAHFRAVPVTTTPAVLGMAISAVYATGTVECEERIRVKARTGGRLTDLSVKDGARVEAGDLLARVDDSTSGYDLERARVELWAARRQASDDSPRLLALRNQRESIEARLSNARQEQARAASLVDAGSVGHAELERREAEVKGLKGALDALVAEERAMSIDLSANKGQKAAAVGALAARVADNEIRSPLRGVVLEKHVEAGEIVAAGQLLFTIGDPDKLLLEVDIDEADVPRVSDGGDGTPKTRAAVRLEAFPERVFTGVVSELAADADRDKKTFRGKVTLREPPRGLRSGMSAELNLITGEKERALLIPAAAVHEGGVWVVRDRRTHRQGVRLGMRDLLRVEVLSGLAAGDQVVMSDVKGLRDGARVEATVLPPDRNATEPDTTRPLRTSL